jgi:hypothetical protein
MTPAILLAVALISLGGDPTADSVTMRDGKVILGQIVEPAPRGRLLVIVRRAWAEKNVPDRFNAWKAVEAPTLKRSRDERLRRLDAWKRERIAEPGDAIIAWIDAEIARLKVDANVPPLMLVSLNRAEVRGMVKRSPDAASKLRQAWRAGFADAETKPLDALASALEGRGFAASAVDSAPILDLLPTPSETEAQWRCRRAATEVAHERSLRLIRHQGLLLPEGEPGAAIDVGAIGGLVKSLLGENPGEDPLVVKGRAIAAKGCVGMMVTTLETAEDLSGVQVEIVLYVHANGDRWERAAARSIRVRGDEVRNGEGAIVAADPQVASIFKTAESLGLTIPEDIKARSLNMGAATQKALAQARAAIQPDLDGLALIK